MAWSAARQKQIIAVNKWNSPVKCTKRLSLTKSFSKENTLKGK